MSDLFIRVNTVVLPTSSISRRIKLWALTEGFIANTPQSIDAAAFAEELKTSGDHILAAMADVDLAKLEDWGDLMDVLHDFEQLYEEDASQDIYLDVTVESKEKDCPDTNLLVNSDNCVEAIVDEMAKRLGCKRDVSKQRIKSGTNAEGVSVIQQTLELAQSDFRDAEDIVSYQEFIIDELRNSIQKLMESQAAVLKEHEEQMKLKEQQHQLLHPHVKPDDAKHQFHNNHQNAGGKTKSHVQDESELIKLGRSWNPDAEFDNADKDGDGEISREEWRAWMEEKQQLIRLHNQEKYDLINELKSLRKSIGPESKELYEELYNGEKSRARLEEEVVRVTMNLETAQKSLARAKRRIVELETEKHLAQTLWKEKIAEVAAGMADVSMEEKGTQANEVDPALQRVLHVKERLKEPAADISPANRPGGWLQPYLASQALGNTTVNPTNGQNVPHMYLVPQPPVTNGNEHQYPLYGHPQLSSPAPYQGVPQFIVYPPPPFSPNASAGIYPPQQQPPVAPPIAPPSAYVEPYYLSQASQNSPAVAPTTSTQQGLSPAATSSGSPTMHTPKPIHAVLYPETAQSPHSQPKTQLGRPTRLVAGSRFPPSDHPMGPYAAIRTQSSATGSSPSPALVGRSTSPVKAPLDTGLKSSSPAGQPRSRILTGGSAAAPLMYSQHQSPQMQQQGQQPRSVSPQPQKKGFAMPTGSSAQKARSSSPQLGLLKELHGWK